MMEPIKNLSTSVYIFLLEDNIDTKDFIFQLNSSSQILYYSLFLLTFRPMYLVEN